MALFLTALKSWAAIETGSVALLGSLADTGFDLLASLLTLFSVRYAALPADDDHRFGHGKAEALSALVQVMLVTNAAQIDHVMLVVEQDGKTAEFKTICRQLIIASIGPTAGERIRNHGLTVDFEPSHGKMGILVKECSEQVHRLLDAKRFS